MKTTTNSVEILVLELGWWQVNHVFRLFLGRMDPGFYPLDKIIRDAFVSTEV